MPGLVERVLSCVALPLDPSDFSESRVLPFLLQRASPMIARRLGSWR
jgi:hypothetical protein